MGRRIDPMKAGQQCRFLYIPRSITLLGRTEKCFGYFNMKRVNIDGCASCARGSAKFQMGLTKSGTKIVNTRVSLAHQ